MSKMRTLFCFGCRKILRRSFIVLEMAIIIAQRFLEEANGLVKYSTENACPSVKTAHISFVLVDGSNSRILMRALTCTQICRLQETVIKFLSLNNGGHRR